MDHGTNRPRFGCRWIKIMLDPPSAAQNLLEPRPVAEKRRTRLWELPANVNDVSRPYELITIFFECSHLWKAPKQYFFKMRYAWNETYFWKLCKILRKFSFKSLDDRIYLISYVCWNWVSSFLDKRANNSYQKRDIYISLLISAFGGLLQVICNVTWNVLFSSLVLALPKFALAWFDTPPVSATLAVIFASPLL